MFKTIRVSKSRGWMCSRIFAKCEKDHLNSLKVPCSGWRGQPKTKKTQMKIEVLKNESRVAF